MDRHDNSEDGGQRGILDKARDAISHLTGGKGEADDADNRMQGDVHPGYGHLAARDDPQFRGAGDIDNVDTGAIGGDRGVDYSSEMGGGAPDTGPVGRYNEKAGVRSVYDRTVDEPGSYDEGERPDRDETLT